MNNNKLLLPSPIMAVRHPTAEEAGVQLFIKREDLIHPLVSGNKWRKLKYNLEHLLHAGHGGIITFGGAFSNHIYATAAACRYHNIPSIGIIRGENDDNNPTLKAAETMGMQLVFVSRKTYREKSMAPEIQEILQTYSNFFVIPEGGSNTLALRGIAEMVQEIDHQLSWVPQYIAVSAGTGCTAKGIILTKAIESKGLVFPALKGNWMEKVINIDQKAHHWQLITDYHFGGYGKTTAAEIEFINSFYDDTGIPLDPIYNGKAMFGLLDMMRKGYLDKGSKVLYIHTGGLQGINGYTYINGPGLLPNYKYEMFRIS
jgi:1-aminocyclopropane-1-carboxylate deaminase